MAFSWPAFLEAPYWSVLKPLKPGPAVMDERESDDRISETPPFLFWFLGCFCFSFLVLN